MKLDIRFLHHVEHADTTVHAKVEIAVGYAGTHTPQEVHTVHTIIAIYALRRLKIESLHTPLGRKSDLKLRTREHRHLDVIGKVEMIVGHHRDAHTEFLYLDAHIERIIEVIELSDISRICVIVKLQTGLNIEIGHDRNIVDAAELHASTIIEGLLAEIVHFEFSRACHIATHTDTEICPVVRIVED